MTMKHLLLLVFFIPSLLWAQDNSKYLAGAIPEDNGKVVFTKEIKAPALSEDQIYDIMLQWAKDRFNTEVSRVVYADKEKGDIATVGEEYLVFQSSALSLDRSLMNYRLTIKCEDHSCYLKVNGIRYEYNVSYKREPEVYTAEEWITDKFALNKKKTKLYRGNGKFRSKTIDFMDELFQSAASALGIKAISIVPTSQAAQQVEPVQQAQTAQPAQAQPAAPQSRQASAKEGYVAFTADKVPSTLLQMLPESKMQITPAQETGLKEEAAIWKGIGNMFGKSVASVSIIPDSEVYKAIGNNSNYNISFFKEGDTTAWLIVECRKVGETTEGNRKTVMGEIINVWVK